MSLERALGRLVPLSDEEQRILREIEAHFEREDPKFVRGVTRSSLYQHAGRQLKFAVAGVVVGLLLMVALLGFNIVASLVIGFGLAFASSIWGYYAFRRMTRAGIDDFKGRSGWAKNLRSENLKRKFKNDD